MFRFLFDIDTWQELKESLTKNKLRTVITMIGVWWGILLLIGLLGSAKGIENKFSVQFGDYATNSVFIWGQSTSRAFKGYQEDRFLRLKFSHLEKIKNQVKEIYDMFDDSQISSKISKMLKEKDINADVEVIFQSIKNLHTACPDDLGDWYFSGNYPTAGGNKVVNQAYINYYEGSSKRAY